MDFRYAAARASASSLSIYVNGTDVTQGLFPSTGSWSLWGTHTEALNLRAGTNTIMIRYDADDNGWINLDYVRVRPETVSAGYKLGAPPTAGWFPKEISVDKFTGTAQLYLPLHTVQANGVALPIGLSYAATGVQVDDRGGEVGVNWALAGGVSISREVRGLPDDLTKLAPGENRYGWLTYPAGTTPQDKISAVPNAPATFSATTCTGDELTAWEQLTQIGSLEPGLATRTLYDTEPDVFYYSLPGHSGKFVFDAQGNARTIPYDHLTITYLPFNASTGITSFTIRTADGTRYTFDEQETITKKVVGVNATPTCFLREYWLYKLPADQKVTYTSAWQATNITTVAGDQIQLTYQTISPPAQPGTSARLIARGDRANSAVTEYRTETSATKKYLIRVSSPTTQVQLDLAQATEDDYYVRSVDVLATAAPNAPLIRKYLLDYQNAEANSSMHHSGYDSQGNPIEFSQTRRFLRRVRVTNGCSTEPLYEFGYHQLEEVPAYQGFAGALKSVVALPEVGVNDRDYWGFYTPNGSPTLIPKLYVYPQLAGRTPAVPGGPYRLYEIAEPTGASGGFTLPGADRRPAACSDFQAALAGTLTSVTLPGGGKALLEYEAHRFYDPVAQQSYPAGGTRIHAIRIQDAITRIEARREYGYQENDGRASGVLLRAPRFAFALPTTGASQQQWTAATVRCGTDLTEDPFEFRSIGYRQVSEQMTGTGQVVTEYQVPGSADESAVAADPASGLNFAWTRAAVGIARRSCPSVAPLQAGPDQYPFAPATNYDFRRGLPQQVTYLSEPGTGTPAAVVRREIYAYEYRNLAPTRSSPVVGLAYEQLSSGTSSAYAYAKYPILTEFLYAIRHQTEIVSSAGAADNQADTWYNYNAQGWLSAQGKTNSDGKAYRTRYKYLTDYPLTATPAPSPGGLRYQAMKERLTRAGEQAGATAVETISEVVVRPNDVRFAGATLNTYAVASQVAGRAIPTRPYQVLRWQPADPLPSASSYDSTRVELTAGGAELHVSPNFRVASTLLETTPRLAPLSTRTEAGRQLSSVHLGYDDSTPVLQITGALASEVLFSDFESAKSFAFSTAAGAVTGPAAARTGQAGVALAANASLSAPLPTSAAPSYRLSFWARPAAGSAATITATIAGGSGGTPPAPQLVNVGSATGAWQLYEKVFDLSGIPAAARSSYGLRLVASSAVQVDDVLFLPATAAAASTTYDLTKGKTSETNGRGRTLFYEYNALGALARVRDHNGDIVKQMEKIVAGRPPEISPAFVTEGNAYDGVALTLRANTDCGNNLSYSWDFGDGSPTAQGVAPSHAFNTGGRVQTFAVRLSANVPGQTKIYTSVQYIEIRPAPVSVTSCLNGVVSIDNCGIEPDVLENSCSPGNTPQTGNNTYAVTAAGGSNLVYTWYYREANGGPWLPTGQTSPSITVPISANPVAVDRRSYQCIVTNSNGVQLGVSQVFSVQRYSSQGNAAHPCPTP
ncbi:carbohydrate-binding protein [Hymenobacter sp. BT664]|uniref:Carbohydrate-binding protein n=1 Tax=Hymenobacter montanus TaxID=2771359 RepID=A0A927GKI1_9BACT|nr:carbohydrate-binding protein [Hymenobacter montanus]